MPLAVAYIPISMPDLTVWYGSLVTYNATRIVISDGNRMGEYVGSFTYDSFGNVYGTLNEHRATIGNVLQYSVSAMTVDANQMFTLLNAADVNSVAQLMLGGNDTVTGSFGADRIHAYGGNDTIRGNGGWDVLFGDGGNDVLFGGAGHDSLYGGVGYDRLQGDAGNDLLNGGLGIDTAVFAGAVATTVNLALATAQNTGHGLDRLVSIENVISGSLADVLRGNAAANMLSGNYGGDRLFGAGGNDRLFGGNGNDRLQGDAGNDLLNGGAGIDTAVYTGAAPVTVNLARTVAQNTGHGQDRLVSIENVITGGGADVLRGNAAANTLTGNGGDDELYGAAGNDVLFGGAGGDELSGGAGNDRLYGGAGDDILVSDVGDDLLDGGAGNDVVGFSGSTSVVVDLSLTGAQDTGYGNDTLVNIEDVFSIGTGDDILRGNDLANILYSGAGNDVLFGGGGDDSLAGWTGDDFLVGGAGADNFYFRTGHGNDTILDFEDGVDVINIDLSTATSFADITVTDLGADTRISFADVTITLRNFDHLLIGADDFLFD